MLVSLELLRVKMEEQGKHWISKVEIIEAKTPIKLVEDLNEFYKDKFIIATQVWSDSQNRVDEWIAIVYYKVPPEDKAGK